MTAFRDTNPRGATLAFRDAVEAKLGAPFVASWVSSRACRFTDTTIFTIALGRDRLAQYCDELLKTHGVTVVVCPELTRGLYAEIDGKAQR